MTEPKKPPVRTNFSSLPSVDEMLRTEIGRQIADGAGQAHAAELARFAVGDLRREIANGSSDAKEALITKAGRIMSERWHSEKASRVKRVINATGVIIHTNLGRAPLSEAARKAVLEASGYANLEYDLATGSRGRRGARAEELLISITGAEDALVVNNCAAAAFFVLSVFASGGEVIISRGELVEIGGDFRVPDVLEQSGAVLREVGTTNRTKLSDYEHAISADARMILRVHPSNYRIVGFTAMPDLSELAALSKARHLLLYEDLGSGALVDLSPYGLKDEPVVSASLANGAHLVSFSGDKLLGGPQCGIIAGKRELIDKLRRHPLQRALRVDKKTFAALEATLEAYARGTYFEEIPVLRQLIVPAAEVRSRAEAIAARLGTGGKLQIEIIDGNSVIGGGAAPNVHPATALIAVSHPGLSPAEIERRLRSGQPPIITRIENGRVLLDLRTVEPHDEGEVAAALQKLL